MDSNPGKSLVLNFVFSRDLARRSESVLSVVIAVAMSSNPVPFELSPIINFVSVFTEDSEKLQRTAAFLPLALNTTTVLRPQPFSHSVSSELIGSRLPSPQSFLGNLGGQE